VTSGLKCVKLFLTNLHELIAFNTQMAGSSILRSDDPRRSDDLRTENRRRVLGCLRASGPCSPAKVANDTGLSPASISSLTKQLVEQGIAIRNRQKADNGSRGRPQSLIELNATAGDIVTLNLAIDLIQVQRINYAGALLHDELLATDTRSLDKRQFVDIVCQQIKQVINLNIGHPVQQIGIAFQGLVDNPGGNLSWSPIIRHTDVDLGDVLQNIFKLPVSVKNDCQLISQALSISASETLGQSFATVAFFHGVGLGLYIDGKPFTGVSTSALELGHLRFERDGALCRCGRKGCIEAYAADYGIQRLANGTSIHEPPVGRVGSDEMQTLSHAGIANDQPAVQAFAIAGAAIGEGLLTLFTLLDPMPVALVGRSIEGLDLMRKGINSVFREQKHTAVCIDDLLHCFEEAEPLLLMGLASNTLAHVDAQFSYPK